MALKSLLSLAFAASVLAFLLLHYSGHLFYQEQYQMFMFTGAYASQVLSLPGGIAEYLSRFTIQFFRVAWLGAMCVAALLTVLQWLTWRAMSRRPLWLYPVSFVPAILMWMYVCDENAMLTAPYALALSLAAAWAVDCIHCRALRATLILASIPVMYMACGPLAVAMPVVTLIHELALGKSSVPRWALLAAAAIALCVACPIIAYHIFPYPMQRLFTGLHYFRFPQVVAVMPWIACAATCLVIALSAWGRNIAPQKSIAVFAALTVFVSAFAAWGVGRSADFDKEEVLAYDYLLRTRQWKQIVDKAMVKSPDYPMTVASLNLALAKTGQMSDFMFRFFQNGTDGLIPPFVRDFTSPLPASEIFYHLGMVNTAQRYAFEINEAIPDYQKGARFYKRLAETNLINGNYEAARKYLVALQHTLFYKRWASETMALLGNEEAIDSNPEYGWLRRMRQQKDVFFSEAELDSMFGLLFENSQEKETNKLAFEYMLAYCLLNRDLNRFLELYPLGKSLNYNHIPLSYQEALVFTWVQSHNSWEGLPWSINPNVLKRMQQFIADSSTANVDPEMMQQKYQGTYWAYLMKMNNKPAQ